MIAVIISRMLMMRVVMTATATMTTATDGKLWSALISTFH